MQGTVLNLLKQSILFILLWLIFRDVLTTGELISMQFISAQREQITILIAHRLSTIMHADKIYVLKKGRIVEAGMHDELLTLKGLYYAMWRQQIGERGSGTEFLLPNRQNA